jgi:hypothetical protein
MVPDAGLSGKKLLIQVVVSFGMDIHSSRRSFPRKRESSPQAFRNVLSSDWIPAFAGMTRSRK